jgi:hypothetical protein
MADDDFSASGSTPPPLRTRTKATPPASGRRRLILRLLAFPAVAVAVYVVFKYGGLRDYLELPQCDSDHAKEWLGQALQPFNFGAPHYESVKTISSSKQEVVCDATLAFPNGSNITVDYSFYWHGSKVNMKYSVPLTGSGSPPPAPPAAPVR